MSHTFSNTGYLSIGDPYLKEDKKKKKKEPGSLKQFTTSPPKKGYPYQNYKSLFEKEKYYDPGYHERQYAKEQRKKITVPFKPSSPSKKSAGSGNYYGTISSKFEHMPEYKVVKKGDKPKKVEPTPKNITTSSPKKGTYGFPSLGISGDYKRDPKMVDDYDAMRKKEREEAKKSKEKMRGAFRSGRSHKNEYFDQNPYQEPTNLPKSKKKKAKKEEKKVTVPFKPSSPSKRGNTIGKYPQYMSEGPDPKKDKKKKKDEKPVGVWRAVSNAKSGPTKSVLFGDR